MRLIRAKGKYTVTLIPGDGELPVSIFRGMLMSSYKASVRRLASPLRTSTLLPRKAPTLPIILTIIDSGVHCQVPIDWEEVSVTPVLKGGKTVIPEAAIQSIKRNTVALKGSLSYSILDFELTSAASPGPLATPS